MMLINSIKTFALLQPNKIALCNDQYQEITYSQLIKIINQINIAVAFGSKIAIVMPDGIDFAIHIISLLEKYKILPLSHKLTTSEYSMILDDFQIDMVICLGTHENKAIKEASHLKGVLCNPVGSVLDYINVTDLEVNSIIDTYDNNTKSTGLLLQTSGTTAKPKKIHLKIINLLHSIQNIINSLELKQTDICLCTMPLFHIHGIVATLLVPIISGGSVCIIEGGFNPAKFVDLLVSKYKPTWYSAVPTIHSLILSYLAQNIEHNLRFIRSSSSALPIVLADRLNQFFNVPVIQSYGMSETSHQITTQSLKKNNSRGSVGYAIGCDVSIRDVNGKKLKAEEKGEICVRGKNLFSGYQENSQINTQSFFGQWFRTGDIGYFNKDNELFFVSRIKEIINRGGEKINPIEIEEILLKHPAINHAVCFAMDHEYYGEEVAAAIVVKEGMQISQEELNAFVLNFLSYNKLPKKLYFLIELPKGSTGKLQRIGLHKLLSKTSATIFTDNTVSRDVMSKVCSVWGELLGLTKQEIDIHEDFFRLGGNSILAIKLINKLNNVLKVNLNISAIYTHKNVATLVKAINRNTNKSITITQSRVLMPVEQLLSYGQERLWFIEQYEQGTNAYNIPLVFKISDGTNLNILEKSIKAIISRHEILRTIIKKDDDGNGYQVVLDEAHHSLAIVKEIVTNQSELDAELKKALNHVFDLSNEYPIKVNLYRFKGNELTKNRGKAKYTHCLSIVIHHIAFDGWSTDVFLKELAEYYRYYINESEDIVTSLNLPNLTVQYKDFALWQRNYLIGSILDKQLSYWKNKLSNYEPLNLITDKQRPLEIDYTGNNIYFELEEDTSIKLRELAKELKVSLYSLLFSAYCLVLRAYSNQDDIVIGIPVANRHYSQIENLIGFFVNSLALRIEIDSKASIKEFIQYISNEVIDAQLHQDLPFEKLVEELKIEKDISRHPIFQVMFGVQSFGNSVSNEFAIPQSSKTKQQDDLIRLLEKYSITEKNLYNIAKFDISTFIDDSQIKLKGVVNYAISLYEASTIDAFIETYITILQQLTILTDNYVSYEQAKVKDLNYLTGDQYNQIINEWNCTGKEYPSTKTIHELFEEQVERTPDSIAVVYGEEQLTYKELNKRANQLANYLKEISNIKPNTLIALCLNKSERMLVGILGILKAGGAYVPIDPNYPDERIKYILSDTNAEIILIDEVHRERLNNIRTDRSKLNILIVDSQEVGDQLSNQEKTNPRIITESCDLAYVIYTSGTTGNPKGVMIEHKSTINFLYQNILLGKFKQNKQAILWSNNIFDVSIYEIFSAILNGCVLHILADLVKNDINKFLLYLKNKEINLAYIPSYFLEALCEIENYKLEFILLGVDKIKSSDIEQLQGHNKVIEIINGYGPTECTTFCSAYICNKQTKFFKILPIGRPISNTSIYVLDDMMKPLPIGAIGELYIGGVGVARGYLNRPELTKERFISNPFQNGEEKKLGKNARLYKTGDLARWLPDGNLEYIGRNDFQVKIRGYRIELGEVENVLSSYAGIKQGVVLARNHTDIDGDISNSKYLVGYYVSDRKLYEETILSYMQTKLPDYMVPSILVHLESMPLTINGKLDRKALPDPEFTHSNHYVAPRNEIEKQVCQIWGEVLGLSADKVGIHDDFFKLGGDSIVSIRLVSRLRQRLGLTLSIKDIFSYKSIEKLYDNILAKNIENNNEPEIQSEQGILSGEVPLLPIQKWFFNNNFTKPNHWNQTFIIKTPELNIRKLQASVDTLVKHHDAFRLRYVQEGKIVRQYYDTNAEVEKLKILDIKTLGSIEGSSEFQKKLKNILTEWQSSFDLKKGPIYSVGYLHGYADGNARICFALHHLVVDSVSWRILVESLRDIYEGKDLGKKGSSYRQWVEAVSQYRENHQEESAYWENVLEDYDSNSNPLLDLVESEDLRQVHIALSQKQTKQLLQESNQTYHTQINDLLLTALGYALSEITEKSVNHIVLEGHGREEIDENIDVTRTVGWFTTMYPVKLEIGKKLDDSIKNIKERLRQIPDKGIGYGGIIGYKNNILPKISFNYLGQFEKEGNDSASLDNFWNITNEISGVSVSRENHNYNIIDINGLVIGGQLKFSIKSKLNEESTNKLAKVLKQKLEEVINWTVKQDRSYLTVSDVDNIISQEYLDKLQKVREIEGVYLANSLQQGFIYHVLNQGDIDDAYKIQLVWEYNSPIENDKLKEAWVYAQKKYSTLRLRFAWEEKLVQVIDREGNLDWRYIDLSKENDLEVQRLTIKRIQEQDRVELYRLEQGGLFRVYLIKQREDLYTCIFSHHHAILDGWSNPILREYIHEIYLKLKDKNIVPVSINRSYEVAQKYLQEHENDNKEYWDRYVAQIEERGDLSGLLSDSKKGVRISTYKHIIIPKEQTLVIRDKLYTTLKELSQREGITLNAILQYVWHKVLNVYTYNNQTVVGITVSGRNLPVDNIENSVGLYINTLPLIVNHQDQAVKSVIQAIRDIQDNLNEINSRSNINLSKLQQKGERLFDSLFVYENYPKPANKVQFNRLKIEFKSGIEKLDYPLGVIAYEVNNDLVFNLRYAGELFDKSTLEHLLLIIRVLLEQISVDPNQNVKELSYLGHEQYKQIVEGWNITEKEYPDNKTIQQLFEEQVEESPDNVAVVYEERKLTYRELNEQVNRLAHYIRQHNVIKPDTLIALCLDRSEYMLISILAILKAGGAYVPIDPNYPDDRISYILEDTSSKVILTNEIYRERLESLVNIDFRNIVIIDSEKTQKELKTQPIENLIILINSNNLAYVIYTSGTTGNPKGVMIEHKGVVNRIKWMNDTYPLNPSDKILQKTPYTFDVSVWELLWAHWYGATIVIAKPEGHSDTQYLTDLINRESITTIHFVPSMLSTFVNSLEIKGNNRRLNLQKIFCSGEALNLSQVLECQKILGNSKVYNLYGPTEASIDVLYYDCSSRNINKVLIGKPISNTSVYVLDDMMKPLPIGAIGELYIGGSGLARGYFNRAELTAERFINNPFQTEQEKIENKNGRLYKTGDLVRWLPDGNLEYIGRNDFQVKIRGYRIELREIENVLSSYERIKQTVVLAKEHVGVEGGSSGNKYLVGYYVADTRLNEEAIQNYLSSKLPEYMVPSILVYIEKLPLTINGKLDRKALPDPEFTNKESYVAPRNELEAKVCQIWAEVLGLAEGSVGIQDDFFRLGGDSIISIQLVSKLRQRLELTISVKDIFNYRNIERLYDNAISKELESAVKTVLRTEQGKLSGEVGLLPIQRWFFDNNFRKAEHWNQSFLLRTPKLDLERLKASVEKLIEHHDAFRLRYKKKAGGDGSEYIQYYDDTAGAVALKILDINDIGKKEGTQEFEQQLRMVLTEWQSGFDLEKGLLYQIGYIEGYEDGSSRLYFALHHLIVDAVSWRILAEDLRGIYEGKELGSKGSSYRQWVEAVGQYGENHQEEIAYWENVLVDYESNSNPLLDLIESEDSRQVNIELSQKQTKQLLQESNQTYHTQINDILLTALGSALAEITGSSVNHIVLEGHGREEIDDSIDITRTVGWFTTMYPVRLEIRKDLGDSLKYIKESLRQVPNKGIGYRLDYTKGLPRVSFNYLGQFDKADKVEVSESGLSVKTQYLWNIVEESSGASVHGDNKDHNIININGLVIDGKLQFSIRTKLGEVTTQKVGKTLQGKLEEIINYTTSCDRSYLTASDIDNIISQEYLDRLQATKEIAGIYLANSLQQGFIYHTLNQGDIDDAYKIQLVWEYNSPIESDKLKEAWVYAQKKYSALRLRFAWEEKLVQIIDREGNLDWRYIDLSKENDLEVQRLTIKRIQEQDRIKLYRLEQSGLFRIYLIKQREDLYTCIFSYHPAILDGWSNQLLLKYTHKTYLRLLDKKIVSIKANYSYEKTQKYLQEHENDNKEYWNKYVDQIEERGDLRWLLSNSFKNNEVRINEYKHIKKPQEQNLIIKEEFYNDLEKLSKRAGVTLNAILQYVWHKVLSVYGGNDQTVVGTIVSGRNLPIDNIENSVGLYINTLPLIVNHQDQAKKGVIQAIRDIQDNLNEINSRSNINLVKLQKKGQRLFDSLFIYENYPNFTDEKHESRLRRRFQEAVENLDYPLGVIVHETNNKLIFTLKYAGELFSNNDVEYLLLIIETLLKQIVNNPDQIVKSLNYLTGDQYNQIINEWNCTGKEYPSTKTIHELFEEQVERTPDSIAVVYGEEQLTYKELNKRANQLANYLLQIDQSSPHLVPVIMDRSIDFLIIILGIFKAGWSYLPIDPATPSDRIESILDESQVSIILGDEKYRPLLQGHKNDFRKIYWFNTLPVEQESVANPDIVVSPGAVSYVIYTSGSTGKPKGAMVWYSGMLNHLMIKIEDLNITAKDNIAQTATQNFDVSVWQFLAALLVGGKTIIFKDENAWNPEPLLDLLDKEQVTIFQTVPSHMYIILEEIEGEGIRGSQLKRLSWLVLSGEALIAEICKRWFSLYKHIPILNAYGPTECSDDVAHFKTFGIDEIEQIKTVVPIGKVLANCKIYVVDSNLQVLPIGVCGELYIGGDCVGGGYLNRSELTAERFIANPFQSEEEKKDKRYGEKGRNSIIYNTGDLARWLPDGNLEYIGRDDFQVKIRGYRIELGEIENVLSSYAGVKQGVVLARNHIDIDGDISNSKYLVGYYISDRKLDEDTILSYMQTKLPDYMVPSILVSLESMPLTINGKLDRKALPDPEFGGSSDSYIAPRNALEKKICQIWGEVLNITEDKIGINHDFFKLGGDSITSIQLMSRLRKQLNLNISIKDIFSYKNIEKLYDNVLSKKLGNNSKPEIGFGQGNHGYEKEYWYNVLSDYASNSTLALVQNKNIENHSCFSLSVKQTRQLLQQSNKAYNTQINDLLLTALGYSLLEITGNNINHIILEGYDQNESDNNRGSTSTTDCFTNACPVRLEIGGELGTSIKNIKETLRQMPSNNMSYEVLRKFKSELLPKISFKYLGQFDQGNKSQGIPTQSIFRNIKDEDNEICAEHANYDSNIINVTTYVINNKFQFNVVSKLNEEVTIKLVRSFKQKLEEIINCCNDKTHSEFTISDYRDFEPYVIFNGNSSVNNKPLFMFPPSNGGAESYFNNMVPKLSSKKLVLFNNYYLYLKDKMNVTNINHITYEILASDYIRCMKSIQSHGSYNLFGYSSGGVLAFEIAKQLIEAGDHVANIILIDAFFNFKTAITQTNIHESRVINNINYKYSQKSCSALSSTKITLFKALRGSPINNTDHKMNYTEMEDTLKIYKYYAEQTQSNHLETILKNDKFTVITMNHTHDSWLQSTSQLNTICRYVEQCEL